MSATVFNISFNVILRAYVTIDYFERNTKENYKLPYNKQTRAICYRK